MDKIVKAKVANVLQLAEKINKKFSKRKKPTAFRLKWDRGEKKTIFFHFLSVALTMIL